MDKLASRTVIAFTQLIAALGIFLFVPAWTLHYWQAWVYWFLFAAASALITAYLWKFDRPLLQRRITAGPGAEPEHNQKWIQRLASLAFLGVMLLPALDRRYSWSVVPWPLVLLGDFLTVLGFFIVFLAFRENTFSAATVTVIPGQRVILTGPYRLVRHPMYSGALTLLLGTPLALGSLWGLLM